LLDGVFVGARSLALMDEIVEYAERCFVVRNGAFVQFIARSDF